MPRKSGLFRWPTRLSHKSKLDWLMIDVSAFNFLAAKEKPAHLGAFLQRCIRDDEERMKRGEPPRIVRGRAFGATSGSQARYFAANGQTADEFRKRKGRKKNTFGDWIRFAAVEMRILRHLFTKRRIDWNLDAVRRELFMQDGEDVLWHLCATFHPHGPVPGSEAALSASLRRKAGTVFRIVDLDEYRASRERSRDASRGRRSNVRVHEGALLMRATMTARVTAMSEWRAVQIFLDRVQGSMGVLPFGRYMAIPEFQWEELIQQDLLPDLVPVGAPVQARPVRDEPFRLEPDDRPPPARASGTRMRIMRRPHRNPVEQQKLPFGA